MTNWLTFTDRASPTGFSSIDIQYFYFYRIGNLVVCNVGYSGTSNSTSFTLTLPYANTEVHDSMNGRTTDNAATTQGRISFGTSSTTLTIYKNPSAGNWTNTGAKIFYGQFFYFTNDPL